MTRVVLVALTLLLLHPSASLAQAPMPLSEVAPGMRCTGLSVVRGTEPSAFDVEVLDVLDRQGGANARILVRVSGPAVDATGVGPGFSGSPILCPGADGTARNAGAISEAIGEFGGKTVLATPIEEILATPIEPPSGSDAQPPARRPGARELSSPLSLAGVSTRVATAFRRAAARAGRVLYQAPGRARQAGAPRRGLGPGSAMAVGLASGEVSLGAIGTVAYVDGDRVWAFGHPFESAGRRSLFLQSAFIHTVINNPVAAGDLITYKLGSPDGDVGTISGDGTSAVTGRLGTLPPSTPLRVSTRDLDTGRRGSLTARIADEADVGLPSGASPLGIAGAAAVAQAATTTLGSSPARQSGDMCVEIALRELRRPLRFCNSYVFRGATSGGGPGAAPSALTADFAAAAALLDGYGFGTLHPTNVEVGMRLRRGARQAFITGARTRASARRGQRIAVRLQLRRAGTGERFARTIQVRLPRGMPTGERVLTLTGTPSDTGGQGLEDELVVVFGGEGSDDGGEDPGPTTLDALRRAFEGLGRYDGITTSFRTPGGEDETAEGLPGGADGIALRERRTYRDPDLRISGGAQVLLDVRP